MRPIFGAFAREEAMSEEQVNLKQFVEGGDGISVIRGSGNVRGWNNIRYKPGLSAKNVGSQKLSMNVATIPPPPAPSRSC